MILQSVATHTYMLFYSCSRQVIISRGHLSFFLGLFCSYATSCVMPKVLISSAILSWVSCLSCNFYLHSTCLLQTVFIFPQVLLIVRLFFVVNLDICLIVLISVCLA